MKNAYVDNYINNLDGEHKKWIKTFINYMRKNHSNLEELMYYSMPAYKLENYKKTKNFICFSSAKNHISMHTLDFEYIVELKKKLTNAGKGKGCVNIHFDDESVKEIIFNAIEKIISRDKN